MPGLIRPGSRLSVMDLPAMLPDLPPPLCPALATFHAAESRGDLATGKTELAAGIFLNCDPKMDMAGNFTSPTGRFADLTAEPARAGDWIGLHVSLPLTDLSAITYVGLVCRLSAPGNWMLRPCLRSGLENGGFEDVFFDKHILTTPRAQTHVDILYLDSRPALPLTAPWRELILFLPCAPFSLSLVHFLPFAL